MSKMFNRARMTITSTGTGALTLGVAVTGYQTFSSAGVSNGDTVSYTIEDGVNWECGTGVFTLSGTTLNRTVTQSYNGSTYGTSPISVTTSAQVFITALAADLQSGTAAGNLVALDGSAKLPAVDGSQLTNVPVTATNFTGTLPVSKGGTGLTSLTAGYIPYGNGTSAFNSSANLTFNGSSLNVGTAGQFFSSNGASTTNQYFNIQNTGGSFFLGVENSSGGSLATGTAAYSTILTTQGSTVLSFGTNLTERMRITSAGLVGIGTTSPSVPLSFGTATGAGTSNKLRIYDSGSASTSTTGNDYGFGMDGDGRFAYTAGTGGSHAFYTANTERARIDTSGNVLVTGGGGLGYGTGSGGAVTQATSKSTAVTLNKASGQIVMNNAALAASTTVTFQLNNTVISGSDIVLVTLYDSVTTAGSYQVWATDTRSGNCQINLRNMTAGSLSNAVYLNFAVIKGVWS